MKNAFEIVVRKLPASMMLQIYNHGEPLKFVCEKGFGVMAYKPHLFSDPQNLYLKKCKIVAASMPEIYCKEKITMLSLETIGTLISDCMCCHTIPWTLEPSRYVFRINWRLWNLTRLRSIFVRFRSNTIITNTSSCSTRTCIYGKTWFQNTKHRSYEKLIRFLFCWTSQYISCSME